MQEGSLDPGLCWSTDSLCQQRDQALLFQCSHRPDSAIFNYFSLRKHLIEAISRPYFYYSNEIRGTNHTAEADSEPPFSPFAQEQNENKDVKNGAPAFRKTRFLANLRWRSVGGVAVQSQPALAVRCSVNRAGCRRDPPAGEGEGAPCPWPISQFTDQAEKRKVISVMSFGWKSCLFHFRKILKTGRVSKLERKTVSRLKRPVLLRFEISV